MDPVRFDRIAKSLSRPETRRRVFSLLAAVPVVGGLLGILMPEETDAAGRRKRRKKAHKHGKGRKRSNRNRNKKKPECTPTTCAAQGKACGSIADGCGTTLDCGPCTCATGCPDCQICQNGACVGDAVQAGTCCGVADAGTRCESGACVLATPTLEDCGGRCNDPAEPRLIEYAPFICATEYVGQVYLCPVCAG